MIWLQIGLLSGLFFFIGMAVGAFITRPRREKKCSQH